MQRKNVSVMSLVLVLLLVTSALLVACTAVAPAPAAPAAGGEANQATEQPAAAAAGNFKPVWYAPAPHPYFEDVRKGIEAFEKETGITVEKQIGPDLEAGQPEPAHGSVGRQGL